MTDRTAQARDAYWNTHPYTGGTALDVDTLRFGVEWADANPQPHTITLADFQIVYGEELLGRHLTDRTLLAFVQALGIEVVEDER